MSKINYGRVILGGVVAGIVALALDWFSNVVLLHQLLVDNLKALNQPLTLSGSVAFGLILLEIIGGFAAVWTYAAIRPRFGAGVHTAAYAGLIGWVFIAVAITANGIQGTLGPGRFWLYSLFLGLVSSVVATIAGAALYKEAESTAAYPAGSEARQATR